MALSASVLLAFGTLTGCGNGDVDVFDIFNVSESEDSEPDESEPKTTTKVTTKKPKKTTTTTKKTTTTTTTTAPEPPPVRDIGDPGNFLAKFTETGLLIQWDAVDEANAYEIKTGELTKLLRDNSITLTGIDPQGTLVIQVRALILDDDDNTVGESQWQIVSFDLTKMNNGEIPHNRTGNELTDNGDSITRKIEWLSLDGTTRFWTKVTISKSEYQKYSTKARWFNPDEYINYLNDPYNRNMAKEIAKAILGAAESQGYTKSETIHEAIRFVQSIPYKTDLESRGQREYPKYIVETIYEDNGDCEDLSILLLSIIRELGFQTCFIEFSDHIAVGILGADGLEGDYYEVNGRKYYYVETTDFGWQFGQIPETRKGEKAIIIEIPMD